MRFRKHPQHEIMVDDEDYDFLSQYPWRPRLKPNNIIYAQSSVRDGTGKYKTVSMHRMILKITDPYHRIDHKDHNGLNNQKSNLRRCSNADNLGNSRKLKPKTSIYKGVSWDKDREKWLAKICVNGKSLKLGRFSDQETAAKVYDEAARKYFGEFACTNFQIVPVFVPALWLPS